MPPYPYKTEPLDHQREAFERTRDLEAWALFWEMGTGKTKAVLDTAAWLYMCGKINGVLVLAPKAVAPNWIHDEIPKHLPDDVAAETRTFLWQTEKAGNKGYQADLPAVLDYAFLSIVVMSYDGIMTERRRGAARGTMKGREFAKALLTSRHCLMVLDESARIKSPSAKRQRTVTAAGAHAAYRRIMTGTPVANSPFDVFTQLRFLDPGIWDSRGCRSFEAFKARYGVWQQFIRNDNGRAFKQLVEYQNLDDLNAVVNSISSRVLKEDVLDLPPKVYQKRYFQMSPPQRALYDTVRDEFMVLLDGGDMISAPLAITRLLRLQQITSGYCPTDGGNMVQIAGTPAIPRLACLMDVVQDVPGQFIVWAKFQLDIDIISAHLTYAGISNLTYDGRTSHADREAARNAFQAGEVRAFVGNPAAAGEGLTLHAAETVVYYNTSFRLTDRLQSEDRAHRVGMPDRPVTYIDIVAESAVDERIVAALRDKADLAAIITGDKLREWI